MSFNGPYKKTILVQFIYLIGLYYAGPNAALFLRPALIRAGVKRAGVKGAVFSKKMKKSGVNFLNDVFLLIQRNSTQMYAHRCFYAFVST